MQRFPNLILAREAALQSLRTLNLAAVLCFALAPWAAAQEWTRFRGPNGSGVSAATTLPVQWNEADFAWRVELPGVGHSSPVLWGDKLFLTSGDEKSAERIVLCCDARDGRQLWSRRFAAASHGKHQLNSFASATPAVDERRVYACWATPEDYSVVALDHTGEPVWRTSLGRYEGGHGFAASPIVYRDLLIVLNEQQGESFVAALDSASGSIRWKGQRDNETTWTTPCVLEVPGRPVELIVANWKTGLAGLDMATGATAWTADVFAKGHVEAAIGSPIVAGELVLGVCGWLGVRQEVVAVRPSELRGAELPKAQAAYVIDRGAPLCTTPLVHDGLLFLCSDQGIVTCADAANGELIWRERLGGTFYGSPVCAGGRLYCPSAEGEMAVLAATRNFELLARNPLGEETHATPAIANGKLFVRTFTHLLALEGRKK